MSIIGHERCFRGAEMMYLLSGNGFEILFVRCQEIVSPGSQKRFKELIRQLTAVFILRIAIFNNSLTKPQALNTKDSTIIFYFQRPRFFHKLLF